MGQGQSEVVREDRMRPKNRTRTEDRKRMWRQSDRWTSSSGAGAGNRPVRKRVVRRITRLTAPSCLEVWLRDRSHPKRTASRRCQTKRNSDLWTNTKTKNFDKKKKREGKKERGNDGKPLTQTQPKTTGRQRRRIDMIGQRRQWQCGETRVSQSSEREERTVQEFTLD